MTNTSKYWRALKELAKRYGRRIEQTGSGHLRLLKEGEPPIHVPKTPGDSYFSLRAAEGHLKRGGMRQIINGRQVLPGSVATPKKKQTGY